MNANLIVGAIVMFAIFVTGWFLYRVYKRVARRCPKKGCGKRTRRIHYIYLHPEDKKFSIISSNGKLRWFFRRVIKITLAECDCGWIRLVRIDWEPISLWHLCWAYVRRRKQFDTPKTEHALVIYGALRKLYHEKDALELDLQETETPPVPDLVEELFQELAGLVKGAIGNKEGE